MEDAGPLRELVDSLVPSETKASVVPAFRPSLSKYKAAFRAYGVMPHDDVVATFFPRIPHISGRSRCQVSFVTKLVSPDWATLSSLLQFRWCKLFSLL
jgi:hypothetical protein